jgi:hypothetical protein
MTVVASALASVAGLVAGANIAYIVAFPVWGGALIGWSAGIAVAVLAISIDAMGRGQ